MIIILGKSKRKIEAEKRNTSAYASGLMKPQAMTNLFSPFPSMANVIILIDFNGA